MDPTITRLCEELYANPTQAIPDRLAHLEECLYRNRNEVIDHLEQAPPTASSYRFELLDAMTQQADRWREVLLDEFERLCSLAERNPAHKSEAHKALDAFTLLADKPNSFVEQFHRLLAERSRTSEQTLAMSLVDVMADHLYKLGHSEVLLQALEDMATKGIDPTIQKKAADAIREVREHRSPEAVAKGQAGGKKPAWGELQLRNSRKGNLAFAAFYLVLSATGVAFNIKQPAIPILVSAVVLAGLGIWKVISAFNDQVQISIDRTGIRTTKRFTPWRNIAKERIVTDGSGSTFLQFEDLGDGGSMQRLKLDRFHVPTARIEEALSSCRAEHDAEER